jgi:hypothetical protein
MVAFALDNVILLLEHVLRLGDVFWGENKCVCVGEREREFKRERVRERESTYRRNDVST